MPASNPMACFVPGKLSMEFRGTLPFGKGIPWNSMDFVSHQVLGNFQNSMEFPGTSQLGIGITWNFKEFHLVLVPSSMEFLELRNSMEFHRTFATDMGVP